jgi:HlyD family secretion protein
MPRERLTTKKFSSVQRSLRHHLLGGLAVVVLLAGGVGGLALTTEITGAVVAPGMVTVETKTKKVQHPTGGVVGELRVRDGDRVSAGDIVVRLDEIATRANLALVVTSVNEMLARRGRLEAERDEAESIAFPAELLARRSEPEVARAIDGERSLFQLRRRARTGQKAQLRERIAQLREEVQGLVGQVAAKKREIELIGQELEGVRDLWRKNLIQIQRLNMLERDSARLQGDHGQLVAAIAKSKGKISETELQIIQIDQELRSEVAQELREVQAKIAELLERKVVAEDQMKRIDIRAPQDGIVHQLSVHTVGGVIAPGDAIMLIVPQSDALIVEAKLVPQDIDQVRPGQVATLRFSAFNQRVTPELKGEVTRVSADVVTDQSTQGGSPRASAAPTTTLPSYYTVRISIPEDQLVHLGPLKLMPGMPVETFIETGNRSVLSYLTKPLGEQIARARRRDETPLASSPARS